LHFCAVESSLWFANFLLGSLLLLYFMRLNELHDGTDIETRK